MRRTGKHVERPIAPCRDCSLIRGNDPPDLLIADQHAEKQVGMLLLFYLRQCARDQQGDDVAALRGQGCSKISARNSCRDAVERYCCANSVAEIGASATVLARSASPHTSNASMVSGRRRPCMITLPSCPALKAA